MLKSFLLLTQLTVACHPEDSLRPLAEEIAAQENATSIHSWADVRGEFLVWVVEPGRLSDHSVVEFATAWRDRFPDVAAGLISGRTLEQARALWKRSGQANPHPAAAFDTRQPVERKRFLEALSGGGYVTFAGHGGQSYLSIDSGRQVTGTDLTDMKGLVIGTASCNVFRPWAANSIALAFAEKGAAAFAGYCYSPEAGYLVGCFDGLPFRHTHPGFPIGRVVQLQNRSSMQAFAALPYYLLLGDPRIAFHTRPAWSVASDEVSGDRRLITLRDAPAGFLPVRIPNGAEYSFVEAAGTAAAREYGYYNSRLQARAFGSDLFVLVHHPGGPLALQLRKRAPAWWPSKEFAVDALDTILVFIPSSPESGVTLLLIGILALAGVFRRGTLPLLPGGVLAALTAALFHAGWAWTRAGVTTVTSKSVNLNPLSIAATFLLAGAAAILFARARSRRGRIAAAALAALPAWLPGLFQYFFLASANWMVFRPRVGASIYNYRLPLAAACAAAILLLGYFLLFSLIAKLRPRSAGVD